MVKRIEKNWTKEEDLVLLSHINKEGKNPGFKLASIELGRTESSCRSRYRYKYQYTINISEESPNIKIKNNKHKSFFQKLKELFIK